MNTRDLLVLTLHPFNLKEGWKSFSTSLKVEDFKPSADLYRAKKVVYKYPNGTAIVLREDLKDEKESY